VFQTFDDLVSQALRTALARRHPLLWTPDSNPVMAVLEVLPGFIRSQPLTVSQADALAKRGAELLLVQSSRITEFDVLEALLAVAGSFARRMIPWREDQLALLLLLKVTHGLGERRALPPPALAAILLEASSLDMRLAPLQKYDKLRSIILPALVDAFSTIPGQVRHTDLMVRFRLALSTARDEDLMISGVGGTPLRELPEDIAKRIEETHAGQEEGPRVDRIFRVGEHAVSEPYRSLPLLLAEALLARGQVLREHRLGTGRRNLEKAFQSFDAAFSAFRELGQLSHAACAAIAATECLGRLASLQDTSDDEAHLLEQLLAYGGEWHKWLDDASFDEAEWLSYARLLRTAYGRGVFYLRMIHTLRQEPSNAEPTALTERWSRWYHENIQEARHYLGDLLETASSEPWQALSLGREACALLREFFSILLGMERGPSEEESFKSTEETLRELCRTLLSERVRDAFVEALVGAVSQRWAVGRLREENPERLDERHPLESMHRLHEAVSAFMRILAWSGQPLTSAQLRELGTALARAGIPALPVGTLLALSRDEPEVVAQTARAGVPVEELLEYVEQRIRTLNEELSSAGLSTPERLLLSGWISEFVQALREGTGDLAEVEPARALALIDLAGASAFRAEAFLFGCSESSPPPAYTSARPEDMRAAVRSLKGRTLKEDTATPESLFQHLHSARSDLDFWSRLKMVHEAGRENPRVREMFAPRLERAGIRTLTFPADMPSESIALLTGVPPKQWEYRDGTILVRQTPTTMHPEEINDQVDRARDRVSQVFFALAARRLVPDGELAPLASTQRIEGFLATHPALAIVVPGFNQEGVAPVSLFFHAEGKTQRRVLGAPQQLTGNEPEMLSIHELFSAFVDDDHVPGGPGWRRLGEALQKICAVHQEWARQLGEHLERHGITQLLFMLRGNHHVYLPWEELRGGPGGLRLGERYTLGYVHTLAELPDPAPAHVRRRQGTLQLHGGGASRAQMEWARVCQQALADRGQGRPPISGEAARDAARLHQECLSASRIRLFLHGHHDRLNPEVDRITLVDAELPEDRVDLKSGELRRLPLAGVECVELWACEGAAHGRSLAEHGAAEEPEDLSVALFHAGSRRVLASRWQVPALTSALMMERFALLMGEGAGEAAALAKAREECRAVFAPGGSVERALRESVASETQAGTRSEAELHATLERALLAALTHLRVGWGSSRSADPLEPETSQAMGRLVRYAPPRSARPTAREPDGSTTKVEALITEYLQPLQNPMCWSGWRLIVRRLEDWRG
jgi:CHAT domain-containing protein